MNKKIILKEAAVINKMLGEYVRENRIRTNLTQQEVSDLIGLHQAALSRVEKGAQALTPYQIYKLAIIFESEVVFK